MLPDEKLSPPSAERPRDVASDAETQSLGLSPERAAALRGALAAHARGVRPVSAELHALLREASGSARQRGVSAERLLVEFKLFWHAVPEVRAMRPAEQADAVGDLVTLCIRAYYDVGA